MAVGTPARLFGIYFIGNILSRAAPFALVAILTRHLGQADYGLVALYQVTLAFLVPVVGLESHTNVTRQYYRADRTAVARLVGSLVALAAGTAVVATGLLIPMSRGFGWSSTLPLVWILALPAIAAGRHIVNIALTLLRNENRAVWFAGLSIVFAATDLAGTWWLVARTQLGWLSRPGGLIIGVVLGVTLALILLRRLGLIAADWDWAAVRETIRLSVPVIPHSLSNSVLNVSDRYLLGLMLGREAVGLYSAGYQIGQGMQLITASLAAVWAPWLYRELTNPDASRRRIVRFTYLNFAGIAVMATVLSFAAAPMTGVLLGPAFWESARFIPWVATGYALNGMYMLVFPYLVHTGKTVAIAAISGSAAAFNVVANILLIPRWGAIAAAVTTTAAYALSFGLIWWFSHRAHPMPWNCLGPPTGRATNLGR